MVIVMTYAVDGVLYRTQTLLLVDKAGHCEYIEHTMNSEAINPNRSLSADVNASVTGLLPSDWKTTQFDFTFL